MAKYIVTGGCGFIGSHLVKKLVELGHEIVVVDNFSTGKVQIDGVQYLQTELIKPHGLMPNIDADGVFHLAAQVSGAGSFDDPDYDRAINLEVTRVLLEHCYVVGIPRFIFASTMGVYGNVESVRGAIESAHCKPQTFYGVHKLASEHYVNMYSDRLNTTNLRLFTVYGPGQDLANRMQGHISIYASYIVEGEPILVKGPKYRVRDFVYVDDVVDAWIAAIDNPMAYGETYNVGSGKRSFVFEAVAHLIEAFGHEDYPTVWSKERTQGDIDSTFADISKTMRHLDWEPKVFLKEGIRRTVEDYRSSI